MKTLLLLRHAKSSWEDPTLQDFERPLNDRGREAAKRIGRYIKKRRLCPDLVLSSPAVRAKETVKLVLNAAGVKVDVRYDQRIYEAGPLQLVEVVSQTPADERSVLLVGHNPGMEELLQLLTGHSERMPTAALAKIKLNIQKWNTLVTAQGSLEWLVKPKELGSED
jgi:phosphohistidine phosphatase